MEIVTALAVVLAMIVAGAIIGFVLSFILSWAIDWILGYIITAVVMGFAVWMGVAPIAHVIVACMRQSMESGTIQWAMGLGMCLGYLASCLAALRACKWVDEGRI